MDEKTEEKQTIEVVRKPPSDEERERLLEDVIEKNKGKMIKMTDEETEDFYDMRKF